jgi:hypothetical protein
MLTTVVIVVRSSDLISGTHIFQMRFFVPHRVSMFFYFRHKCITAKLIQADLLGRGPEFVIINHAISFRWKQNLASILWQMWSITGLLKVLKMVSIRLETQFDKTPHVRALFSSITYGTIVWRTCREPCRQTSVYCSKVYTVANFRYHLSLRRL